MQTNLGARLIIVAAILLSLGRCEAAHAYNFPPFIHGHNICSANVNRLRHAMGLKTTGSNLASSWLQLPRVAVPHVGSVRYNYHHVSVYLGNGMCANPSAKHQRWDEKKCIYIWEGKHYEWHG